MIEVEGTINNRTLVILIDSGASHSYVDPRVVESLHLMKSKHEKSLLVQLATRTKRKVTELVNSCLVDMKGMSTKAELNILPLGSYDCLIGMDWLDQHHALLDCRNKMVHMPERRGKSDNSPRNSQSHGCEGNLSHAAEEMLPERMSIICSLGGRSILRCSIESGRP
jgi:hypothetical protein